jgi:hypothetical protein
MANGNALGRLDRAAEELQDSMAKVDLLTQRSRPHGFLEALLLKKE